MIYTIMEETKKNDSEKMSEEKMTKMVSEFSKGLTLWGSNRVVKKWLRYRKSLWIFTIIFSQMENMVLSI